MPAPTIHLATDDDMRAITSQNLAEIAKLPTLYIPTENGQVMRDWGVAHASSNADYVGLYPEAPVAPHHFEQFVDRCDVLYNGAEPAVAFVPRYHRW